MTDLSPALKLELQRVINAEQRRLTDIARAWKYYDGEAPQPMVPKPIRNDKGGEVGILDDNVRVNFSRLLVDAGVHYLFGQPLGINFEDEDETIGNWLGECLPMMERMMLLQKLANNGGVAGHTFARLLLPEPGQKYPRVIVLDPGMVKPTWDPKDIDRVVRWKLDFIALDPATSKPTQYRTVMEPSDPINPTSWALTDSEGEPGTNLEITDETTWPYPFSPVVHCQNLPRANEFYGAPDLEADLLDLQSDIDKVLSNGNKIVRNWSKPPTVTFGMAGANPPTFTTDPDGVTHLPGNKDEASIQTLDSNADMPGLLNFEKLLVDHLREIGQLPEAASGKASGALSSLTLKLLFAPIVQKTEAKHNTYGTMVTDLVRRLLVIGKQVGKYDDAPTPDLHWEAVVPNDDATEIARDEADLDIGFSKATLIERRGGDPETEKQKREEETQNLGEQLLRDFAGGEEPEA